MNYLIRFLFIVAAMQLKKGGKAARSHSKCSILNYLPCLSAKCFG